MECMQSFEEEGFTLLIPKKCTESQQLLLNLLFGAQRLSDEETSEEKQNEVLRKHCWLTKKRKCPSTIDMQGSTCLMIGDMTPVAAVGKPAVLLRSPSK